ncbi:MAG: DUF1987 domain-containing protein [Methylococcaceae bacterium]|nr:DUF1987 domain-containing protein [Methylococcaceae bacterium]
MNNLTISAGKDTLSIECDSATGIIKMSGISYPQDAADFFNPVFDWLESYINEISGQVILNLYIDYLNTSSTKCLFDFIDRLEDYYKSGNVVQVNWYHEPHDEDIKETGLEFQEDMELPFAVLAFTKNQFA